MIKQRNKTSFTGSMQSAGGYIRRQKWSVSTVTGNAPTLGTTTYIHAAVTGTSALITTTTGITQPDFPRVLSAVVVGTTASGNIVINGTDMRGNAITDTIAITAAGTYNGVKAFSTVTSFTIPATVTSATTVSIGTTAALGLDRLLDADEYISGSVAATSTAQGVYEATRATITTDSVNISGNTVAFNTALNGTKVFRAAFITKEVTSYTQTTN